MYAVFKVQHSCAFVVLFVRKKYPYIIGVMLHLKTRPYILLYSYQLWLFFVLFLLDLHYPQSIFHHTLIEEAPPIYPAMGYLHWCQARGSLWCFPYKILVNAFRYGPRSRLVNTSLPLDSLCVACRCLRLLGSGLAHFLANMSR